MRRVFAPTATSAVIVGLIMGLVIGLVGFLLAGCNDPRPQFPEPSFSPLDQQNVMGRLAVDAGYNVSGIPQYDGTRWTINVTVDGCTGKVMLGGNPAPQSESPKSFEVLSVGGVPFAEVGQGANGNELPAAGLRGIGGMSEKLGCTS